MERVRRETRGVWEVEGGCERQQGGWGWWRLPSLKQGMVPTQF
jgi:hypothetical protein